MKTTTTTKEELEERQRKRQNSLNNLRPLNTIDPKEAHEIRLKGVNRLNEIKREKKTLKESALNVLNLKVPKEYAKTVTDNPELLEQIDTDNLELQDLMNLSLAKEVVENGNARAYEALRDTSGQRPKDQIEVEADITTEADRVLMLALKNRLGIEENS